jgi:putative membrane protein
MAETARHVARQADRVSRSADKLSRSAGAVEASVDRSTELAADRTVLAAERTYAAWVRTGLAALASGVGARALLGQLIPGWLALATASMLVVFSVVCFSAAVWRELYPGAPPPRPDTRRMPRALLLGLNGFLVLVDLVVLIGIWSAPGRS